ncbi:MAG: hemolysin family protein [Agathobacter sp.]|nr:hemolysin family protein [Agathobacter sp.]
MDDGANPNILIAFLTGAIIILLILLVYMIYVCKKNSVLSFKGVINGDLNHSNEDVTEEEIISMVKEGHEKGTILASEVEMIHNIFEFDDKEAKDIMTHRKNIIGLDGEMSYIDAVSVMIEAERSRYPVYLNDLDHIIGVLHIKDAFSFMQKNEMYRTAIKDVKGLVKDVEFVPETLNINTLFKKMQDKKNHLVMVVDEYGQISGLVALEDVLEEIVGNIEDEHDNESELIKINNDGSYVMDGITEFNEVIKVLKLPIEENTFETLNGFLVSLMEKIPADGEKVALDAYGYKFSVLSTDNTMINQVKVTKIDGEEDN